MSLDQRRPSASLRTRRPSSAIFNDGHPSNEPIPAVPILQPNHLTQYFNGPGPAGSSSGQARPPARHAKSSDTDARGTRSRGATTSSQTGDSKVGAFLLNKRQSVSFGKAVASNVRAGIAQDIPGVPSLPDGYSAASTSAVIPPVGYNDAIGRDRSQRGQPVSSSTRRGAHMDTMSAGEELISAAPFSPSGAPLTDLLKEDFVADAFLKAHLSPGAVNNATIQLEDLRKLKAALNHMLESTQNNLQTNVIQNYGEFIKVSKEITALENEMLELKTVLEEWKTVPEGLEIEQSFDTESALGKGYNRRNSLADLQALYKTQLEALWEAVEGAQRFLPATPGRHVLSRHSDFLELNNATYRPKQTVILILLNDALLVGVEKRRQMGLSVRVVADKCFNLNEIAVTDLKDQGGLTNAIRIKRDREVHIFRHEKPEDKKQLLLAFKKILEETMHRKRKESVWEAEFRRDTGSMHRLRNGGAPTKHPLAGFKPSKFFPFITTDDPSGKDLSWVDDVSDHLATHVALREYEEAVTLIEKAKSVLPAIETDALAESLLKTKIEQRSAELTSVLLANLADTNVRKTGVVKLSSWLLRLGQGERARETFLGGRGELLKQRTGEIHFASHTEREPQGLIEEVAELSFVCFTLIRNTCEWYMAAYKDHQTASAFVRWASAQVEVFAEIFKQRVYGPVRWDPQTVQTCVETAKSQAAMLKDVGLDFAFLLTNALRYSPPALPPRSIPDAADLGPTMPLAIKKKPHSDRGAPPSPNPQETLS